MPVTLARGGADPEIELSCTLDEAPELPAVDMVDHLRLGEFPVDGPEWDVGISEMLALPCYQPVDLPGVGVPDPAQGGHRPLRPRADGRGRDPPEERGHLVR